MKKKFLILLASCMLVASCDHYDRVKNGKTKTNDVLVMDGILANSTFIVDMDTIVSWLENEKWNITAFDVGYSVCIFPKHWRDTKFIVICDEYRLIECLYLEQNEYLFFAVKKKDFAILNYKLRERLANLTDYDPNFVAYRPTNLITSIQ